jgi:hypothetical protein
MSSITSTAVKNKRAVPQPPPKMPERTRMLAPNPIVHDPDVLPALRELFSQHPAMKQAGCEDLSGALFVLRIVDRRPTPFEVEATLEALIVEGEVLA